MNQITNELFQNWTNNIANVNMEGLSLSLMKTKELKFDYNLVPEIDVATKSKKAKRDRTFENMRIKKFEKEEVGISTLNLKIFYESD